MKVLGTNVLHSVHMQHATVPRPTQSPPVTAVECVSASLVQLGLTVTLASITTTNTLKDAQVNNISLNVEFMHDKVFFTNYRVSSVLPRA